MSLKIIAGKFKGRILKTPKGPSTRPTQGMLRESVFNICQNEIEGSRFLDLFAGSGAMGLEAISRGAAFATLVEQHPQALTCIKENIAVFQAESATEILAIPAEKALSLLSKKASRFDIVYIDPPYDLPLASILKSIPSLLSPGAVLFVEERVSPQAKAPDIPGLILKNSRRFGIALLHQYREYRA